MAPLIVVDRPKLRFLLAGRAIQVEVGREYRKGRSYAVGTSHKSTICRAEIIESEQLDDGWRLTIRRVHVEEPRLLARNPAAQRRDYVTRLADSARDEPEAPRDDQLLDLTAYRAAVAHNGQRRAVLKLRDRVMAELDEALRTSISREDRDKIRAAKHHVGKLGRAS